MYINPQDKVYKEYEKKSIKKGDELLRLLRKYHNQSQITRAYLYTVR